MDAHTSPATSLQLELLAQAGRLLLEYNESAGEIQRLLMATARSIAAEDFLVVTSYGSIGVSLGHDGPVFRTIGGAALQYEERARQPLGKLIAERFQVQAKFPKLGETIEL